MLNMHLGSADSLRGLARFTAVLSRCRGLVACRAGQGFHRRVALHVAEERSPTPEAEQGISPGFAQRSLAVRLP